MRILVLEDDRVQQGRIEQTLLDIGRSRNLRLLPKTMEMLKSILSILTITSSIYWI